MPALITTILPTYRRPKLLRRALRSVLAQTFRNFEVCVYDNASGDETADVVAAFASRDSRVRYYCQPQNIGAVPNFNCGIQDVATPYFSLLSDDDLLMPEMYARAIQAFQEYPAAWAFCSRTVYYDAERKLVGPHSGLHIPELAVGFNPLTGWPAGYYEPSVSSIERMTVNHFINTGVVFKTEVRNTIGVLNHFGSDMMYMAKVANTHPFVVSEYTGGVWSIHGSSFSAGLFRTPVDTLDFLLSFLLTLLDMTRIDVSDRARFVYAFHELAGHMLVAQCLKALAERNWVNFRAALDLLRDMRLPFKGRLGVACADLLSRSNLIGPLGSRLAAFWLRRGLSSDIPAQSTTDREILQYIASLETEPLEAR